MPLKSTILRKLAVRQNVVYGKNLHVGPRSILWAPRRLEVGNDVYIGKNATIEIDGYIGDGVLIANNVGIVGRTDHDTREVGRPVRLATWVGEDPDALSRTTRIGSDVWVGFGAIILSGVIIGDSSIVAAGAVVSKDVPPNTIVTGNPAREHRRRFSSDELENHWSQLKNAGVRLHSEAHGDFA